MLYTCIQADYSYTNRWSIVEFQSYRYKWISLSGSSAITTTVCKNKLLQTNKKQTNKQTNKQKKTRKKKQQNTSVAMILAVGHLGLVWLLTSVRGHLAHHAALLTSAAHKCHKLCSEVHNRVHPKFLWSFETNQPYVHSVRSSRGHNSRSLHTLKEHGKAVLLWWSDSILTLRLGRVSFKEMAMYLYCPLLQAIQTLRWNHLTNWWSTAGNRLGCRDDLYSNSGKTNLPSPLTGRVFFGWCKLSTEEYITVWPTISFLHLFSFISDNEE